MPGCMNRQLIPHVQFPGKHKIGHISEVMRIGQKIVTCVDSFNKVEYNSEYTGGWPAQVYIYYNQLWTLGTLPTSKTTS